MTAIARHTEGPSLEEVQARIDATKFGALSLEPNRSRATRLPGLVDSLAPPTLRKELRTAAATVGLAQLQNFPDNLFWDFDAYLAAVHRDAAASDDYATYLHAASATTETLMRLYGQHSEIRFRYVHDFAYGFDWARWVRREPDTRSRTGPFAMEFLTQSEDRGRRILELIEADDAWYPQLRSAGSRNPFSFSREPDDELMLYRDLAARGHIPVHAWCVESRPRWDRDFDAIRNTRATALGLGRERHDP
ncbi:MAG: hypothetical protein WBG86_06940 [Polyangiales bacterium]